MRLLPFLVRFAADRRGATAIVFVLALPIIIGMTGLGVESGYWYFKHRELQTAADVAAIAGAVVIGLLVLAIYVARFTVRVMD